jgi:transcriptional regulator with AAA-type ATPase domain/ligand-binding sensor domain-containing protein
MSSASALARLCFWVPVARLGDFEAEYRKKLLPLLSKHGLEESAERGRPTVEGVFSRLFEVERPAEAVLKRKSLQRDGKWQELLSSLGTSFGAAGGLLAWHWGIYAAPAGTGRAVEVGPGYRQGLWWSLGAQDGLPAHAVFAMLHSRADHLWLATQGGGVCRYDGAQMLTLTCEDGLAGDEVLSIAEDRKGRLWFGSGNWRGKRGAGVSRYDGERFITFTTEDGLAGNWVSSMVEDREGNLWFGTEKGVSRYDRGQWQTFTAEDGLANNGVWTIKANQEGQVWFGTWWSGACRYDGKQWQTFTTEDGLANNQVRSILVDCEGQLWFGTWSGLSRYEGARFATFTTKEGLANDGVMALLEDREGKVWFGTWGGLSRYDGERMATIDNHNIRAMVEDRKGHLWFGGAGGASRYDGQRWVNFAQEDGQGVEDVLSIAEDREGHLWFGGVPCRVSRYDGRQWKTFTLEDRLAPGDVRAIAVDCEGYLWFGTNNWGTGGGSGVSRYDGQSFKTFTTAEGLAHNGVLAILADRKGHLWFGTEGGVSRYEGQRFVNLTTRDGDGLAHPAVTSIMDDREGRLWFGTYGGGVSLYDGLVFQSLSRKDGLVHDAVQGLLQDHKGDIWIATEGGVTRYRPSRTLPLVRLTDVVADRRYGLIPELSLPVSQKLLAFEFQGSSLTTQSKDMAYVYRLEGYQEEWQPTRAQRVEYQGLPLGEYTFQVRAVDCDLNYSAPASIRVSVVPDPQLEALGEILSAGREKFVGRSPALRQVQAKLAQVALMDLTVLILGETGTGKGLAARTVHRLSRRQTGPFIQVNCGALPQGLVESELFGHEKGAFTGATSRKLGKVELAEGGTLFLDEIGDLPLEMQVKLLRFLEEYTFERVGGTQTLKADARVIAATNRALEQMMKRGEFREDLYFRLQVFPVRLPPLRERQEDIPLLATYFAERMAAHLNKDISLAPEALAALETYPWPGNVRELEHVVQRAVVVCRGSAIGPEDIALDFGWSEPEKTEVLATLEENQRQHIRKVLEQTGWVIKGAGGAAVILGLPESTVRYYLKKLGIQRKG